MEIHILLFSLRRKKVNVDNLCKKLLLKKLISVVEPMVKIPVNL